MFLASQVPVLKRNKATNFSLLLIIHFSAAMKTLVSHHVRTGNLLLGIMRRIRRLSYLSSSLQLFRERLSETNVHATIPKGNMGYEQYTVPDSAAVKPTFVAFL